MFSFLLYLVFLEHPKLNSFKPFLPATTIVYLYGRLSRLGLLDYFKTIIRLGINLYLK